MCSTDDLRDRIITGIALRHLGIKTLERCNSDRLDFHDVAVWSIEKALREAYEAGQQNAEPDDDDAATCAPGACPRCGETDYAYISWDPATSRMTCHTCVTRTATKNEG